MKKFIKEYWLLLTVVTVILVVDQITKAIVRANIPFGGQWMPLDWLAPFFRIVHWENTGAAFGLFQGGGLIFGILAVIVSAFIAVFYQQIPRDETWMRIGLSMQMGGALGNLLDRIRFGPVLDFIAVGNFPVFNIADSCITIGVGVLIFTIWLNDRKENQNQLLSEEVSKDSTEPLETQI